MRKTYAAWGIDYLKYDWCARAQICTTTDDDAARSTRRWAMRCGPAAGRSCSACANTATTMSWKWGAEVGGNLWRTTGDISRRVGLHGEDRFAQNDLAQWARPGHWNDPDMLEIGNGRMTDDEYRTHMSLWSMLAAPLLAGNDLRDMTPTIESS